MSPDARAPTALITGASSGIGRELARLFAVDGTNLVLLARRQERLDALAAEIRAAHGVHALVLPTDLTSQQAPTIVRRRLHDEGLEIDILVNSAGFGLRGSFVELSHDRLLAMIALNVTALTTLTRLFLPAMLARNRGGVLNVGSTAAFPPGPLMAVYYASKAYVHSLTQALAEEAAGTDLRITCLAPGPTATEFAHRAGMEGTRLFGLGALPPEEVARIGYRGWKRGQVLVVPGLANKAAVAAMRFAPPGLLRKLIHSLNSPSPRSAAG